MVQTHSSGDFPASNLIGTLKEKSLHADLKSWYQQPGDEIEVRVDNYIIDIKRGNELIEIQTQNFTAIRKKLRRLAKEYPITLIHPIIQNKWINRIKTNGKIISRRKSPKRGRVEEIFKELVRAPDLAANSNITILLPIIQVDEFWMNDGKGSWRRKRWSISDRKLIKVLDQVQFNSSVDLLALLPTALPAPFTNKHISAALKINISLATKMTYCLRKLDLIEVTGKKGNTHLHKVIGN